MKTSAFFYIPQVEIRRYSHGRRCEAARKICSKQSTLLNARKVVLTSRQSTPPGHLSQRLALTDVHMGYTLYMWPGYLKNIFKKACPEPAHTRTELWYRAFIQKSLAVMSLSVSVFMCLFVVVFLLSKAHSLTCRLWYLPFTAVKSPPVGTNRLKPLRERGGEVIGAQLVPE